jgi:molybdate transport system substrate-binding protein
MAAPSTVKLTVLSAGAVKYVVTGLAPAFTKSTGVPIDVSFGTIAGVQQQLKAGARPDVIIGTVPAVSTMEQSGLLLAGSTAAIGHTRSGLGVREGTPSPDISTSEEFRQTLLDARSIAYTSPAAGGTSGIYLESLLGRLGIANEVAKKAQLCINGDEVVDRVASGEAAIGSTFISEIITRPGMKVVGPFPAAIGHGMSYAAGLAAGGGNREAARAFIGMLTDPAQREFLASRGFEAASASPR